jgi:hypothetical protein
MSRRTKESDAAEVSVVEKLDTEISTAELSVVSKLLKELEEEPESGLKLVHLLGRITKPWEELGNTLSQVNEIPVPPNMSAKEYLKGAGAQPYTSGWKLTTIFGREVAVIVKDTPKYRILIEGQVVSNVPFIQHAQKVETIVKQFVEEKVRERGYIIG